MTYGANHFENYCNEEITYKLYISNTYAINSLYSIPNKSKSAGIGYD